MACNSTKHHCLDKPESQKCVFCLLYEAQAKNKELLYMSVSERCRKYQFQNCVACEDIECCDNMNPKARTLQAKNKELEAERDRLLDTCLAAAFIGNGTQIVGDKRYEELLQAEAKNKEAIAIIEECREFASATTGGDSVQIYDMCDRFLEGSES